MNSSSASATSDRRTGTIAAGQSHRAERPVQSRHGASANIAEQRLPRDFGQARTEMPMLDQGLSALFDDLHSRGMDKDVSVVVWGEFGRTPFNEKGDGRDHNPFGFSLWLAGGGGSVPPSARVMVK